MKKSIWLLIIAALLLSYVTSALADQYTYIQTNIDGARTGYLNADIAFNGNGTRGSLFYVNSDGKGKLVLEQKKGECYTLGYSQLIQGITGRAEEWGKYEIEVNDLDAHTYRTYQWDNTYNNDTFTISLEKSGRYYIYVRPYTQSEMTSSYTITQFGSWNTPPRWWIKERRNCTVSTEYTPSFSEQLGASSKAVGNAVSDAINSAQKPAQDNSTAAVVIQYITDDGKYNLTETQILSAGTHTIKSKTMDGYTLKTNVTPGNVTVTVKNGVADPSNIIFLFEKQASSDSGISSGPSSTVRAGDHVIFGHYPQTSSGNDYTPIEWQVLEVQGGRALLISVKILDGIKYHNRSGNVTWNECYLREWLNNNFYYMAFTSEERQYIQPVYHDGAEDRVFILNFDEARNINIGDNYAWRRGIATEYAKSTGLYYENGSSASWWLRTSRSTDSIPWAYASGSNVKESGEKANGTSSYGGSTSGVRPVIWVNTNAIN